MKPQGDQDLKRAFINCLNKLTWSQKSTGARLLDVYENLLGTSETEKNAERLAAIEAELDRNREETRQLTAIIMRERFLPEHREKKVLLDSREKELLTEKNTILMSRSPVGTLQQLKSFLYRWKITDDPAAFPEEAFSTFVESCTIRSHKTVTFHFRCGLRLTESLSRVRIPEQEVTS